MKLNLSLSIVFAFISSFTNAQSLKINEIMASNTTYASDLGNFGDWVEIYNPSNQDVDLSGYYVTDDYTVPTKYQIPAGFPTTIIPAGGYTLIWADDSTRVLHTNFKLSGTSGERFALVSSDGTTFIDSISFGIQTANVSYGRVSDGAESWTTFGTPTPNASNAEPTGVYNNDSYKAINFVYPNPVQSGSVITLGIEVNASKPLVFIHDLSGRVVHTAEAVSFVMPELKAGLYTIRCLSPGNFVRVQSIFIN